MRLSTTAVVPDVSPLDLYAVAADLSNLPAWWIEHLHAAVTTPAPKLRDAVYEVQYRLPIGIVITATCTMVAARAGRSLTYMWQGGGMRLAVGQDFEPELSGTGTRVSLIADLHVGRWLMPVAPIMVRLMRRELRGEIERALETLGKLAAARAVMRGRRATPVPGPGSGLSVTTTEHPFVRRDVAGGSGSAARSPVPS